MATKPTNIMSNEVHRKTDTSFPGNSMTAAELEPLTIWSGRRIKLYIDGHYFLGRQCGVVVRTWASWSNGQWFKLCCFLERECLSFCEVYYSYNTYRIDIPNQLLYQLIFFSSSCPVLTCLWCYCMYMNVVLIYRVILYAAYI